MLKDEVIRLSLTLRKLQSKHNQVLENFRREQINSRALTNDLHSLQEVIKGKEKGKVGPQSHLIVELQKQVIALKHKVNRPASHHVQTAELVQAEKDKASLADSLAKEREEKTKILEEMAALQGSMNELQISWDTHVCAPPALEGTSSLSE